MFFFYAVYRLVLSTFRLFNAKAILLEDSSIVKIN